MSLTRRAFLERIAQAGGYSAAFRAMQVLGAEAAIGERGAAAIKKKRADRRRRRLSAGRQTTFCSLGHVSLASHSRHLNL